MTTTTTYKAIKIRKGEYSYRGYRIVYGRPTVREQCMGVRNWICIDICGTLQFQAAYADTKAQMMAMIDAHIAAN